MISPFAAENAWRREYIRRKKRYAAVFKKIGEQHQMVARGIHISPIDTGEEMFYYKVCLIGFDVLQMGRHGVV